MNGILASVQRQYISHGSNALPDPATAERKEHAVEVTAGHIGRVKIFYNPQQMHHYKHSHWYWSACRAEPVVD